MQMHQSYYQDICLKKPSWNITLSTSLLRFCAENVFVF